MSSIVAGLAEMFSQIECQEKGKENPKPALPDGLRPIEERIWQMMIENTGCHILDSGGAYGRNWERNRHIDFRKVPACRLEVWDDEVIVHYSTFHYLTNFLEITDKSEQYNKEFHENADRPENQDKYWLELMEEYGNAVNTYNYENLIDQVLQYVIFEDDDGDYFIILQIHGGCDVRGGYTDPQIFSLSDPDDFIIAQFDVYAFCGGCENRWLSDDAGIHYYYDGCSSNEKSVEEYWEFDSEKNEVRCKCGSKIEFHVTL
jgi:hypothetical protein